jgi:hypothetical protein
MKRLVVLPIAMLAMLVLPAPALGHSLVGRLESPLPLAVYLVGAAMAVGLSFAFVILRDVRRQPSAAGRVVRPPRALIVGLRAAGLVAWLWIVGQAIVGGSSDADVASLFLLVYGWVGVAMLSAFVGPVWTWLDPFTTLFDIGAAAVRRLGIRSPEPAAYPRRLGAWPAVVGLVFFVWLELVYRGQLGLMLVGYTMLTLAAMAQFGRDAWREAETFSVWFGTLNRLAPFGPAAHDAGHAVIRRTRLAGLFEPGWTRAHVVLVAIGAGSILYDGLSQTQLWFDLFGLPAAPLATAQLLAFLALIAALALAVAALVGRAAVGAGLVPIAVGYLVAHYFTYLLSDGQRIVVALSDPLQLGWDLFGTAFYQPSIDWLPPSWIWSVMVVSVVGGHVVGAWAGHVQAARHAPPKVNLRVRQLPLAVLMVGLTATTLWSLGQAIVQEPSAPPAAIIPWKETRPPST